MTSAAAASGTLTRGAIAGTSVSVSMAIWITQMACRRRLGGSASRSHGATVPAATKA